MTHDALYRVANIDYSYRNAANAWSTTGHPATDWRATQDAMVEVDPMRRRPAPMVGDLPDNRVVNLTYRYDWLANQTEWVDDAHAFYERSLGSTIRNGYTDGEANGGALRPTALYLAAQLPESPSSTIDPSIDRGGWVRVRYGESGNATSVTVRARCHDVSAATACWDDSDEQDVDQRASQLLATCRCDQEQHYEYRWDELNRLAEARRYDRAGSGDWALEVRQRYRYDAGNIRTLKETVDGQSADPGTGHAVGGVERVALYVMPGDFERRGLVVNRVTDTYDASVALGTETQYLVAGARVVWKPGAVGGGGTGFERDARVTLAMSNLLQSTAGVVDLVSGELLEVATYYPNGARETLRANTEVDPFALEPVGFTGKEDDSEVGLVYFGMRYLMPHLGRWASPDPLQIHAGGGGEFGNSYHYVSGNLLQARDPLGLDPNPLPSASRLAELAAANGGRVAANLEWQRLRFGAPERPNVYYRREWYRSTAAALADPSNAARVVERMERARTVLAAAGRGAAYDPSLLLALIQREGSFSVVFSDSSRRIDSFTQGGLDNLGEHIHTMHARGLISDEVYERNRSSSLERTHENEQEHQVTSVMIDPRDAVELYAGYLAQVVTAFEGRVGEILGEAGQAAMAGMTDDARRMWWTTAFVGGPGMVGRRLREIKNATPPGAAPNLNSILENGPNGDWNSVCLGSAGGSAPGACTHGRAQANAVEAAALEDTITETPSGGE